MSERLVVVVRLTGRCNLACGFCAFDRRRVFERRDLDADSLLRLGTLLAAHRDTQALPVHLSLLGGEPTLWAPLERVEPELARDLGLSLGITTNGTTLPDAAFRRRLLTHYDELTLSIDAPGKVHDELRAFPDGFARLRSAVRSLVEERARGNRGLLLRVNTVLMRRTLPSFEELCKSLADWGIDEITFNALGGADRPEFYEQEHLLPAHLETFAERLPRLRADLATRGVALRGGDDYVKRLELAAAGRTLPVLDCRPGERFLFADHQARLSPCSFTAAEYGISLSSLRSAGGLGELSSQFRKARELARSKHCDDCRSTQVFSKWALPASNTEQELSNAQQEIRSHGG